jgi:hypothetical protein
LTGTIFVEALSSSQLHAIFLYLSCFSAADTDTFVSLPLNPTPYSTLSSFLTGSYISFSQLTISLLSLF